METSADQDHEMSSARACRDEELEDNETEEESEDDEDDDDDEQYDDDGDDDDDDAAVDGENDGEEDENEDSDSDDDEEEEEEDEMLEVSETDGETEDRCPICLNRFREQDVGTPEACDHVFCLECIVEWSKNVNTCPVDRQVFRLIMCRHGGESNIFKRIIVADRNRQAEEEEDLTYCEVCNECDREDRLLLCDGCDKGYHLECLTPPLHEVPINEWFCPECADRQVEEDETIPSARPQRRVPRTLVMERVRSAIEELRVRRVRNLRRILSDSEDEAPVSTPVETSTAPAASSVQKKTTPKKRKTPRKYRRRKTKRKTTTKRKRKTTKKKTTKRKTKGKRRKGRKGKKRARTVKQTTPVTTVKSRIAGALGIETPPAGRTIPTQKNKLDKPVDSGTSLSIFGSKEELIHFDDDYGADTEAFKPSKFSRSALSSYKPIGRVPVINPDKKKKIVIKTAPVAATSSMDLLGSIMQDQSKLHMDGKNVQIQRDGSLISKQKSTLPESSSSSKFFKSSFTAVTGGSGPSILNTLGSPESKPTSMDEEYDPAHPTDELDEEITSVTGGEKTNNIMDDEKYDPAHPTDELDDVSDEEMEQDDLASAPHNSTSNKHVKNIVKQTSKSLNDGNKNVTNKSDKSKNSSTKDFNCENSKSRDWDKKKQSKDSGIFTSVKSKGESHSSEQGEEIPLCKELTSPSKLKKPETNLKVSPSVKITETGKKVSPSNIKPFEISKKILVEKKRLYGGEIDFTEDVTFTDAGFENFEVNIKAIESVFKGTVNKPEDKVVEEPKPQERDDKENEDSNKKPEVEEEKKEESIRKDESSNSSSKKLTPSKSKSDKNKNKKEKLTVNERFKMLGEDPKDNDLASLEEEDPIHEMRKLDKELDLELGNPDVGKTKNWHKNKSDSDKEHKKSKRKVSIDRDEDGKVRHRKDGKDRKHEWEEIEEGEVEDERQYRERKRREKREKKRKAAEKEKYYDAMDTSYGDIENPDAEIDTRIVVQVSQNTDSRTVWEEDEKIRRKKEREERVKRKEKRREDDRVSKKDRKRKRRRSRSRSYDRHDKSKSRERKRSRSRSRERSKRRHRDRSRSRSVERSRKKKKKDRDRSRDKRRSRSHSRSRSRSRERSEDRVDIFGRSRSPFRRKGKERESLSPVSPVRKTNHTPVKKKQHSEYDVFKIKRPRLDGEVITIDDDDDDDEEMNESGVNEEPLKGLKIKVTQEPSNQPSEDSNSRSNSPKQMSEDDAGNVENDSNMERRESSLKDISSDERDEFSDEPEETEQFNYTDRDEFHIQNKHNQQHQNLIQVGVDGNTYDPANPTESLSPGHPPLPDSTRAPTITPPLPPTGDFAPLFPPPPPRPPPPPPTVFLQDRPPEPPHVNGPPGPRIIGEQPPLLIQGPPPMEQGPPQGMLHQRPNISVPININVVPPGFHRGLPQTIQPQRQIIVNAFRPGVPRLPRLPSPSVPRFGFTTTSEVVTPQFGLPSLPGPGPIGGPYDGLPPPSEGPPQNLPPPQSLPPPQNLPPHSHFALGSDLPPPPQHILPMQPDGPPPSNLVQIPVEIEDRSISPHIGPLHPLLPPVSSTPNTEPQLVHLGPMNEPHPRLPIPLLPTSEPHPPPSVMVSLPPPVMSMPPPNMAGPGPPPLRSIPSSVPNMPPMNLPPLVPPQHVNQEEDRFIESRTPPSNHIDSVRERSPIDTSAPSKTTVIPGLDMVEPMDKPTTSRESDKTFSQLEKISKLLTTQAKLILVSKTDDKESDKKKKISSAKDDGVFKVPLPPGTKTGGGKPEVETTEVVDMDMASPILEEGNIELPVSPQFDNLIDTDDWLEEVYDNKTKKSEISEKSVQSEEKSEDSQTENEKSEEKINDLSDKWMAIINSIPIKHVNTDSEKSVDKPDKQEVKEPKKISTPVKLKENEVKKDSPAKKSEPKKHSSKENKHRGHHHRKHKQRPPKEDSLKQKAQVDTELDLDSQELTSAVDMTNKEKYLRKLHLQERVVEEVKMAIKPHYAAKKIDKDQYKEIMRKAVPKICHSKSGDINPMKIKSLIEAYVERYNKHAKNDDKKEHSPSVMANGERSKTKAGR